jgi:hypothetical protein
MNRIALIFVLALVVGLVPAMADVTWSFSYVGVTDLTIAGSGTFTTGTSYGDGYLPILSINGTTNLGGITGLETSGGVGIDPALGTLTTTAGNFNYDNAFSPVLPNFSLNGLLFDLASGPPNSPVNIYYIGPGTYEFSYGRNGYDPNAPGAGGSAITFNAQVPDGGTTLSLLGLAMVGLAGLRRKLSL